LALRQAQLTPYLHQLYANAFSDWSTRSPEQAAKVRRLACAAHRWRRSEPDAGSPLEAFMAFRERWESGDDEVHEFAGHLDEATLTRFEEDPTTARLVPQAACAFYYPDDFPTHAALVELLISARFPEHPKEEIDRLATPLRAWTATGPYGRLF